MKELTKEQKIDFILYCMERIDSYDGGFLTCCAMDDYFGNSPTYAEDIQRFPELLKYSNRINFINYREYYSSKDNATRAIIYCFLWNELTGQIKID